MLRLVGCILLIAGTTGIGWSMRCRLKDQLSALYQLREILRLLQQEILYSKASLPEASARIAERLKNPYRRCFEQICKDAQINNGNSFTAIWQKRMGECLERLPVSASDKRTMLSFGDCVGYMDPTMQARALDQYMHRLDQSIELMEKDLTNKGKVVMCLWVMGGLATAIMLL